MSGKRSIKVAGLLKCEISDIIQTQLKDPLVGFITITDVVMSDDLKIAKVYFSTLGVAEAQAEALEGLRSASGWLRRELGRRLRLRNTPELIFHYDHSLEHGEHISSILDELGFGDDERDQGD